MPARERRAEHCGEAACFRIAGPSVIEPLGRVLGDGDDRMAHGGGPRP